MKTRRRRVRERICRNYWRRRRLRYDPGSIEIWVNGVLLVGTAPSIDWRVGGDDP